MLADQAKAGEIVGADRLLKPGDIRLDGKSPPDGWPVLLCMLPLASTKSATLSPMALRAT